MNLLLSVLLMMARPSSSSAIPETRMALGADREMTVRLTNVDQENADQRPHVDVVIQKEKKPTGTLSLDFDATKYPQLEDVLRPSFSWDIELSAVERSANQLARIGLVGRAGEDLMVVQEIAVLLDVSAEPKVVWIGLGWREENQFDTCVVRTTARFRLVSPGIVEKRTTSKKAVSRGEKGDALQDYRNRCKAAPTKTETISVGGG